ncbi:MAG: FAD-binding domain-containing protein [Leeuwenhoekiella sp.]
MIDQAINIFWFKRDLRLADNDALYAAKREKAPLLLLYVHEPTLVEDPHHSTRHWRFIFESLVDINQSLSSYNSKILVLNSEVLAAFSLLLKVFSIKMVFSTEETGINKTYQRDLAFAEFCKTKGIQWKEFQNGGVQRGISNRDTWRKGWYDYMTEEIKEIDLANAQIINFNSLPKQLSDETYEPQFPAHANFQKGGRTAGKIWEESFFNERVRFYSEYISKPENSRYGCSRLSPYIAWGCLSIREIYQRSMQLKKTSPYKKQLNAFNSRLRWQAHFIQKFEMEPRIEFEAFNKGYLTMEQPYREDYVTAWKEGRTGYPLVDASMRAVRATGYLNFRMRTMSVSFLLHHLFQHFTTGAHYLAQMFLDFDPGIHYPQFQMQSGFTATNTIRIYNPTKNAHDHDADATFIKKWVPELRELPAQFAIEPWLLTDMESALYDFQIGKDYPERIVDIKETRAHALQALYGLRKADLTQKEKQRILDTHTLKNRFP